MACIDAERRIINAATNYSNERVQFNKKISEFGAVSQKLAKMQQIYMQENPLHIEQLKTLRTELVFWNLKEKSSRSRAKRS